MPRINLHPPRWRLIVHADDLGVDAARDQGILDLAKSGDITSASVLINGAHAVAALAGARACGLPLGLHLNLSEGTAVAGPSSLTEANGHFLGKHPFRRALHAGRITASDLGAEIRAQIDRFVALEGRLPGHVDGHQHCHVHPRVAPLFARILATEYGICRVRLPCESPAGCVDDSPEANFHAEICRQAKTARTVFDRHHLRYPDAFMGLTLMGRQLSAAAVATRLRQITALQDDETGPRVVELMCHPGYPGTAGDAFNQSPERAHEQQVLASAAFLAARRSIAPACFTNLPVRSERQRVLIVSKLQAACGNHTTAVDLARQLAPLGDVLMRPLPATVPTNPDAMATEAAALARFVADEQIDLVLGIHAWRCGALFLRAFAGRAVPWMLLFSGTDGNVDLDDPARRATIAAALTASEGSFALSADLIDRVRTALPACPPPRLLQPPTTLSGRSPTGLRDAMGLPPTRKLILLPAGIRPVKGILEAISLGIEALQAHPQHVLVIVGPVLDADYARACDAAIAAATGVAGRLFRIAAMDRPDYLATLHEADLLLNTSISEGLPNALLEAMAAGVPILAHDIAGNRALIGEDHCGLLYRTREEFRDRWSLLLADTPVRDAVIRQARTAVRRRQRRIAAGATLQRTVADVFSRRRVRLAALPDLSFCLGAATHPPDAGNFDLFSRLAPSDHWRPADAGGARVLDLGCGCGVFGVAALAVLHAARIPVARLTFADSDAAAVDGVRALLARHAAWFAERLGGTVDLASGDLFAALPADARFDLVLANLPQTPSPRPIAGDRDGAADGAGPWIAFLAGLPAVLAPAGEAFILHIGLANPRRVFAAAADAGLRIETLAEEWRTLPESAYAQLDPDLPAHISRLIAAGTVDAESVQQDGDAAFRFPARLLRLTRI